MHSFMRFMSYEKNCCDCHLHLTVWSVDSYAALTGRYSIRRAEVSWLLCWLSAVCKTQQACKAFLVRTYDASEHVDGRVQGNGLRATG